MLKQVLNVHSFFNCATAEDFIWVDKALNTTAPTKSRGWNKSFGAGKNNAFLEDIWTHECIKNVQNLCKPVLYPVHLSKLLDTE